VTIYIPKGAPIFSGSPLLKTPQLTLLTAEQSRDGWLPSKFPRQHVREDETYCKDIWWFVGSVDDP